jgi:hypothetical protein
VEIRESDPSLSKKTEIEARIYYLICRFSNLGTSFFLGYSRLFLFFPCWPKTIALSNATPKTWSSNSFTFSEERQGRRPKIDRCRQLEMAISNLSVELRDYI